MQSLFHGSLIEWLRHVTPYGVKACFWALRSIYVEPWFWVSMIAIFALERLAPVVGRQRTISKGVIEDFVDPGSRPSVHDGPLPESSLGPGHLPYGRHPW